MISLLKIWNSIKNLDTKVLAFIGGAVLVMFMMQQCNRISHLKADLKEAEERADNNLNNYIAAKDTVTYFKNELGETVAERDAYVFELEDLNKAHENLKKEYAIQLGLNKELLGVNNLLRADIELKEQLLAKTKATSLTDSTGIIEFGKSDSFSDGNTRLLTGSLDYLIRDKHLITSGTKINLNQTVKLRAAILEEDGKSVVRISTAYPGLTINDVENISLINNRINQEPKSETQAGWSIGIGVGYGVNLNANGSVSYGPTIGAGLYWSPKWLRF